MWDVKLKNINWLEQYMFEFDKETIETGKILFYGDSYFTRWSEKYGHRPLTEDIRMKNGSLAAVNHGFGTSTAEDQLYFYHRAVFPWMPRTLVLRTFGNDIGAGYSPAEIMFLRARLCDYARHDFPGIRMYLADAKLNLQNRSSRAIRNFAREYNELLAAYCEKHDDCVLVEESKIPELYDSPEHIGDPDHFREELFVEDKVHFNQMGYDVYKEFYLQVLDDIL